MAAGALAGLVVLAACFGRPTFACEDAAQCVVGPVQGFCEDDGLCSYLDDVCPSGRRYSPYAGELAEACVDDGTASTAGTGVDTQTPSTTEGDATATQTSGIGSTGSDTDCGAACPEPGMQLWSTRASELGFGRGHGVAVGAAGIAVAGEVTVDDHVELVVATFDPQTGGFADALAWPAVAGGPDRGQAIAALPSGGLVVVGSETGPAGHVRGVVVRVDDSLASAWARRWDSPDDDVFAGVAVDGDGRIVTVGSSGTRAVAVTYADTGDEVQSRVFDPPSDATAVALYGVAAAGGSGAWVSGTVVLETDSGDAWARRLNADGGVVLEVQNDDPSRATDAAFAIASLGAGDAMLGGTTAGNAWLSRVGTDGGLAFARAVQDGGDIRGLAPTADGGVVAVGHAEVGDHRDAWIAAFDVEGELVWEATHDTAGLDDEAFGVTIDADVAYVTGYATDTDGEATWVAAYTP